MIASRQARRARRAARRRRPRARPAAVCPARSASASVTVEQVQLAGQVAAGDGDQLAPVGAAQRGPRPVTGRWPATRSRVCSVRADRAAAMPPRPGQVEPASACQSPGLRRRCSASAVRDAAAAPAAGPVAPVVAERRAQLARPAATRPRESRPGTPSGSALRPSAATRTAAASIDRRVGRRVPQRERRLGEQRPRPLGIGEPQAGQPRAPPADARAAAWSPSDRRPSAGDRAAASVRTGRGGAQLSGERGPDGGRVGDRLGGRGDLRATRRRRLQPGRGRRRRTRQRTAAQHLAMSACASIGALDDQVEVVARSSRAASAWRPGRARSPASSRCGTGCPRPAGRAGTPAARTPATLASCTAPGGSAVTCVEVPLDDVRRDRQRHRTAGRSAAAARLATSCAPSSGPSGFGGRPGRRWRRRAAGRRGRRPSVGSSRADRVAQQLAQRRQPRRLRVVVGADAAAEHHAARRSRN